MNPEESDPEDPDEIPEKSPCGRWHRRKETVSCSAVPGIDAAYLAMDIEEGLEVIWNEVKFSESKDYRAQEKQMSSALDSMISITHPNIVKFHHYWTKKPDTTDPEKSIRVVFITEYTSSGTLRAFLRKTNDLPTQLQNWSRWCNQLLSALHYMHNLNTVHGNLTTDTIFLQHHGLLKIGCFSITTMRSYVKTNAEENNHIKNSIYFPNEEQRPKFDIYSFGVIALEMLMPKEIADSEKNKHQVGHEIARIDLLNRLDQYQEKCSDKELEKCEFIRMCLNQDPSCRPDAKTLSRHTSLFTISQLRILSAHAVHDYRDIYPSEGQFSLDTKLKNIKRDDDEDKLVCFIMRGGSKKNYLYKNLPFSPRDLDKLVLDVQNGLYPIMPIQEPDKKPDTKPVPEDPTPDREDVDNLGHGTEHRRAAHIECFISRSSGNEGHYKITIDVDLARPTTNDESQNRTPECKRHLETQLTESDDPYQIARELANFAFISVSDIDVMYRVIQDQYNLVMPGQSS